MYFHDYKLAIEIDENGHSGRNMDNNKKKKDSKQENKNLTVYILELILNKKTNIFITVHEIFRHIKRSTKKTLISKISTILLGIKFTLDNIIKSKSVEFIVKKDFLIASNNTNLLSQL